MLRSSLCDYSDACILVKGTITVANTAAQDQANNCANKKVIYKNCAPFTNCINRINNTQADDASYVAVNSTATIVEFTKANSTTESFNFKEKLTGHTGNNGTKMLK